MKKNINCKVLMLSLLFCILATSVQAQSPGRDNAPSREERKEWNRYSGTDYEGCKGVGKAWHQTQHCGWDDEGKMRYGLFKIKECTCVPWNNGVRGRKYTCEKRDFLNECYY